MKGGSIGFMWYLRINTSSSPQTMYYKIEELIQDECSSSRFNDKQWRAQGF